MQPGNIIFLNGTSSSGKTGLAKLLQQTLAEPYLHASVDDFVHMLPERVLGADAPPGSEQAHALHGHLMRVLSGMHYSIAALAQRGNNVIVDHVLESDGWLQECVAALEGLSVLFVGVHCSLPELERRERERGNRVIGLARAQYPVVHANRDYDLTVDTSAHSFEDCAQQIAAARVNLTKPTAFDRLRDAR
jgi:chloramphenicol 3-O phosphotransferase